MSTDLYAPNFISFNFLSSRQTHNFVTCLPSSATKQHSCHYVLPQITNFLEIINLVSTREVSALGLLLVNMLHEFFCVFFSHVTPFSLVLIPLLLTLFQLLPRNKIDTAFCISFLASNVFMVYSESQHVLVALYLQHHHLGICTGPVE